MEQSGAARARARHDMHASPQLCDGGARMFGTPLTSLNFSIDAHVVRLFKLSQQIVKILYGIKTIMHLNILLGPEIYLI
jgi:hypothetical protein